MNFYNTIKAFSVLCVMLLAVGCVKDQDFDQGDEIAITPDIETDLVYLQLTQDNFVNSVGEAEVSFVSQTTNLNFLREGFIQNDLSRIDFTFATKNSFKQSFNTIVTFLDEAGQVVYEITFFVPGSSTGEAVNSSYVEVIQGDDLQNFKKAVDLQVSSSIILSGDPIMGELDFQSKARLYFEFN
ncbi:MAG TPA: hypothetical protein ENH91_12280 [Leeuwenhoekiella sp.]|nr:hypothetical protein [Leeuwenhoekiella sp.]